MIFKLLISWIFVCLTGRVVVNGTINCDNNICPKGKVCQEVAVLQLCPLDGGACTTEFANRCVDPCPYPLVWNKCVNVGCCRADRYCGFMPRCACGVCESKCVCPDDRPTPIGPGCYTQKTCSEALKCPEGQIFEECGSACPPTCDSPPLQACPAVCRRGCSCPEGLVKFTEEDGTERCILKEECPKTCVPPLVFNDCGPPDGCDKTCENPDPHPCNEACYEKCTCPASAPFLQTDVSQPDKIICVSADQCCPEGLVYDSCGSACPLTCDNVGQIIPCILLCVAGCRCPQGLIKVTEGDKVKCITPEECPAKCEAPFVFNECAPPEGCDETCLRPFPGPCSKDCNQRCTCPRGTVLDKDFQGGYRCVKREECCPAGLIYDSCGSACPPTCEDDGEPVICLAVCVPGCRCPNDLIKVEEKGVVKCITRDECDPCKQPLKVGPCRAAIDRYFYNSASGNCEVFSWGGCQPNGNNFMTFVECARTCYKRCPYIKDCMLDYCPHGPALDKHGCVKKCECACPCKNFRCQKGEVCIEQDVVCVTAPCPPVPVCVAKNRCDFGLPGNNCGQDEDCKDGQFCSFDENKDGICCDKDANPCEYGSRGRRCSQKGIACPSGQECILDEGSSAGWCCASSVCGLPPDSGCGRKKKIYWYFNPDTQMCQKFRYGGKGGNGNRFATAKKCEKNCKKCQPIFCALFCENGFKKDKFGCDICECNDPCDSCPKDTVPRPVVAPCLIPPCPVIGCECIDICSLPKDIGPCDGVFPKWYHNSVTSTCEQFEYGGCDGNENLFDSLKQCERKCGENKCRITNPEKQCKTSCPHGYKYDKNDCIICQCYDPCYKKKCPNDEVCEVQNVICKKAPCLPIAVCVQRICEVGKPLTDDSGVALFCGRGPSRVDCPKGSFCVIDPVDRFAVCCRDVDVCSLPADSGPCDGLEERFYYNPLSDSCERFPYGGCGGNGNRFETREDCVKKCGRCPVIKCTKKCKAGRVQDENGCDTCECIDPCILTLCPEGTLCVDGECIDNRCEIGFPQRDDTGAVINCGRGGQRCEEGWTCNIHPTDRWAVCCKDVPVCEKPLEPTDCVGCPPTCDNPVIFCRLACREGCKCPASAPIFHNGKCITADRCPAKCRTEECETICPAGYVIDADGCQTCVCQNPCAATTCSVETPVCVPVPPSDCTVTFPFPCPKTTCIKNECGEGTPLIQGGQVYECHDDSCPAGYTCNQGSDPPVCCPESRCTIPPDSGPCADTDEFVTRWYYDVDKRSCKPFIYSGCGGNKNQFVSEAQCQADCVCGPPPRCDELCKWGTIKDRNGCPTCDCAIDPCAVVKCGSGTVCYQFACDEEVDGCNTDFVAKCVEPCPEPQIWNPCEPTGCCREVCGPIQPHCLCRLECNSQCVCPPERPIAIGTGCFTQDDCADAPVCEAPLLPSGCATCQRTCDTLDLFCIQVCRFGCACPSNTPILHNGKCIKAEECPKPEKECKVGAPLAKPDGSGLWKCGSGGKDCPRGYQCVQDTKSHDYCCPSTDQGACMLPKEPGPCRAYFPSWYYDYVTNECLPFIYGGCLGNGNRFSTKEECEMTCAPSCYMPIDPGMCKAYFPRWGYNPMTGECEEFIYGGCQGNTNNFPSEVACQRQCRSDCEAKPDPGPCKAYFPKWYYDAANDDCYLFIYGGCFGNSNRFDSYLDCVGACKPTVCEPISPLCDLFCPSGFAVDKNGCELCECVDLCEGVKCPRGQQCVPDPKVCVTTPCDQFQCVDACKGGQVWKPCPGPSGCDPICGPFLPECAPPPPFCIPRCVCPLDKPVFNDGKCIARDDCPDICSLPPKNPPCEALIPRWFYDPVRGRCEMFTYGGCDANENNFISEEQCERVCGRDICDLPYHAGTGEDTVTVYTYDNEFEDCVAVPYTGSGGNENRFVTLEQCLQKCKPCPNFLCQTYCPNGYRRDSRGCLLCECNDDPCMDKICRPGEKCIDGQCKCPANQQWDECCSACEPTCEDTGLIFCTLQCIQGCCCPGGLVRNEQGYCVKKEQCPGDSCPELSCDQKLKCKYGLKRDRFFCEICECFEPCEEAGCGPDDECVIAALLCVRAPCYPPYVAECVPGCPQIRCSDVCEFGTVVDENGCPTCQCKPGCKDDKCPVQGQVCEKGSCVCPGNQVLKTCGSACTPTCDLPDPICTEQCVERCECESGTVLLAAGDTECIPLADCPKVCPLLKCIPCAFGYKYKDGCQTCECINPCKNKVCQIPGQICDKKDGICKCPDTQEYQSCGSACTPTCATPVIPCTLQCVERCQCPFGSVLLSSGGTTCVPTDKCKTECKDKKGFRKKLCEDEKAKTGCVKGSCRKLGKNPVLVKQLCSDVITKAKCCKTCKRAGY